MASQSRAQRRAKNIAKQEKLKRERASKQADPVEPAQPPIVAAEPTKIPEAPVANLGTDQQRNDKASDRTPATWAESTIARCTVVLAILAAAQLTTMVIQNNIMREQIGQTGDTLALMRQERAAMVAVTAPVLQDFEPGKPTKYTFGLENSGGAAAKIKTLRYTPFFADSGENLRWRFESWDDDAGFRKGLSLAPGNFTQVEYGIRKPYDAKEVAHIKEEVQVRPNMGVRTLYFAAEVFYNDDLGTEGHTRTLYYYLPETDRFAIHAEYGIMERKYSKGGGE